MKQLLLISLMAIATISLAGNKPSPSRLDVVAWQSRGLDSDTVFAIYVGQNGTFLAGTLSHGVKRSTDNGGTWTTTTGLTGNRINGLSSIAGSLWAGTEGAGMYKSTDDGLTWAAHALPSQLPATISIRKLATNLHGDFLAAVFDVPSDEGYGIGRSTDGGASWAGTTGMGNANITDIITAPSGEMYCCAKGANGLFKSTDNGASWAQTNMTTQVRVYGLGCSKNGVLFASTCVDSPNAPVANGIYRSTDNGGSWSAVNNGVPSPSTFKASGTIVFGGDGSVYVGSLSNGVLRSTDDGNSWTLFNDGLPAPQVVNLTVDENGTLYSCGLGVWSSTVTTGVDIRPSTTASTFALEQNYPNPFNPSTVIVAQLPRAGQMVLSVYDALGRRVAVLADGWFPMGRQSFTFNATNLSSGVYVYRLESGAVTISRTMTLVR